MKLSVVLYLLFVVVASSAMDDRHKIVARISELHPNKIQAESCALKKPRSLPDNMDNLDSHSCIIDIPQTRHTVSLKTQSDRDDMMSIDTVGKISELAKANEQSKERCCTPAVAVVTVTAITAVTGIITAILTTIVTLTIHFTTK